MRNDKITLYKHTSPSGKVYVGITGQNPEDRWQGGRGYRRNEYFSHAIMKYGWDNFAHEILAEGLNINTACELERALIAQYKSTDKRYGYNITPGGEHFKHSEESKQKMSANRKGKGRVARSEETKALMRKNHAGGAISKSVICIETRIIYPSVKEAARAVRVLPHGISACCRNLSHYNTAAGYHWRFAENEE